jgi:Ohr subfamily peroxiredoxin
MIRIEKIYTALATATGGREGHVQSSDGVLDLQVRVPIAFGGPGGPHTNPEQLFAAGYAACFGSALQVVIAQAQIQAGTPKVHSHVSIGKTPEGGFGLAVQLEIDIPGVAQAVVQALAEKAHQICPYSNATRGNILVEVQVAKSTI